MAKKYFGETDHILEKHYDIFATDVAVWDGNRAESVIRSVNNLILARYRSGLRLSTRLKMAMSETTILTFSVC